VELKEKSLQKNLQNESRAGIDELDFSDGFNLIEQLVFLHKSQTIGSAFAILVNLLFQIVFASPSAKCLIGPLFNLFPTPKS
jgi:hypothetical protein